MQKNKTGTPPSPSCIRVAAISRRSRARRYSVAAIAAQICKADHVARGAVVIDVGIQSRGRGTSERGYRLVGDVAFAKFQESRESRRVPGGVDR